MLLGLLFLVSTVEAGIWSVGCGIVDNNGIYELKDLARAEDDPWLVNMTKSNGSLAFNLCSKTKGCGVNASSVWAKTVSDESCTEIVTQDTTPTYSPMTTNKSEIVIVTYNGSQCNASANYSLSLQIKCNHAIAKENALPRLIEESECGYSVLIEVDKGCPIVSVSVILAFITIHTPLFSVGFIVLGIALGIYGRSMWPTIVFGLVTFSFIALSMVLLYEFILPFDAPLWSLWLSLFGSALVGSIIACFSAKNDWIGFILLGAWLGATSTLFLTNIYARIGFATFVLFKMWKINLRMGLIISACVIIIPIGYVYVFNDFTFWVCFIAIAAVYAYSAYLIKDLLITVATSLLGAYLSIRGLSMIVGGFTSEYDLFIELKHGRFNVHSTMSIYIIAMLVLALGFILLQEYIGKNQEDQKDLDIIYQEMEPIGA